MTCPFTALNVISPIYLALRVEQMYGLIQAGLAFDVIINILNQHVHSPSAGPFR
jgi:hypothetical protein